MFEREIKFIHDFNVNKISKLGSYLTLEQLMISDLHPAILRYIDAEIEYLIFEDRRQLIKNSAFDYSGDKIDEYFRLIAGEIKNTKRLSVEYISKLILHSISFTVNYLTRPRWTLGKFLFDDERHKTTGEIKQILNYLYYYDYLKKILFAYINQKKLISINNVEFDELLIKIDTLGKESYQNSLVRSAADSISDFFNIGSLSKNVIPVEGILMFLEEKGLSAQIDKLKKFDVQNKPTIEKDELLKLLNETQSESETDTSEQSSLFAREKVSNSPVLDLFEDSEGEIAEDIPAGGNSEDLFSPPPEPEDENESVYKLSDEQADELNAALKELENTEENIPADSFAEPPEENSDKSDEDLPDEIEIAEEENSFEESADLNENNLPEGGSEVEIAAENKIPDDTNSAEPTPFEALMNDELPEEEKIDDEIIVESPEEPNAPQFPDSKQEFDNGVPAENRENDISLNSDEIENIENNPDLPDLAEETEQADSLSEEVKTESAEEIISGPEAEPDTESREIQPETDSVTDEEEIFLEDSISEHITTEDFQEIEEDIPDEKEQGKDDAPEEILAEEREEENLTELSDESVQTEIPGGETAEPDLEQIQEDVNNLMTDEASMNSIPDDENPAPADDDLLDEETAENNSIDDFLNLPGEETSIFGDDIEPEENSITNESANPAEELGSAEIDSIVEEEVESNSGSDSGTIPDENSDAGELFGETIIEEDNTDETDSPEEILKSGNTFDESAEDELDDDSSEVSFDYSAPYTRIEISDILEHKNTTKIIEVIFDYDMEDFANAIEKISEAENLDSALAICDRIIKRNGVTPSSKEAQNFREIISEYFGQ